MNLAQLIGFHRAEAISVDLIDGWTFHWYPYNTHNHNKPQCICRRYTFMIANDSMWMDVPPGPHLVFDTHWILNAVCGCWISSDSCKESEQCFPTFPCQYLHDPQYSRFKDAQILPVPENTCPFQMVRYLSVQFRDRTYKQYRYVYCDDDSSQDKLLRVLESIPWPSHLRRPRVDVSEALRIATYFGTLSLFPFDLNVLILDYLVRPSIQKIFI